MSVVIFRDYPEENFPSMEVYRKGLVGGFEENGFDDFRQYLGLKKWSKKLGHRNLKTRFLFRYFLYPLWAVFNQGDVNHILDQTYAHLLYFLKAEKTVVTVHDLDVLRLKFLKWQSFRDKLIKWFYLYSVRALRKAGKIIAVSEDTKRDLQRFLGIPSEKIVVIEEGVEAVFKVMPKNGLELVRKKYQLPEKFILHVGECWQYKNIEMLLRMMKKLIIDERYKDLKLVKVGGEWTENQLNLIENLGIKSKIIKLPFVPRRDLPMVYNLASVLVQPSFLEGFGLTVLEAMACGCPVVVADVSALKSLVKEAGLVVKGDDLDQVANGVRWVFENRHLRQRMVMAGLARAKLYTWFQAAKKTLAIYEEIRK